MTSRSRLALLVTVVGAALLWLALRSDDGRPSMPGSREVVDPASPAEKPLSDLVPTPAIDTVPYHESVPIDVPVVDKLSREVIPSATLVRLASGGEWATLGVSDDKGVLRIDAGELRGELAVRVPARSPNVSSSEQLVARLSSEPHAGTERAVLEVDLNARIDVIFPSLDLKELSQIHHLRAYSLPPIPDVITKPTELRGFVFARSHSPHGFIMNMRDKGLVKDLHETAVKIHVTRKAQQMMLPYSGDVVVECLIPGYIIDQQLIVTRRGDIVNLSVVPRAKPHVAGQVVSPDGLDVSNLEVTVSCRARFPEGEWIPPASNEPGGPAMAVWRKNHETGAHALVDRVAKTDAAGRFLVHVPFTGHVGCRIAVPGWDLGRVDQQATGNYDPVTDIVVSPKMLPQIPRTMRLVNELGEPLPNQFLTYFDLDDVFKMKFPRVKTDVRGWFDITLLTPGNSYTFAHSGLRTLSTARDGGVVRVLPQK